VGRRGLGQFIFMHTTQAHTHFRVTILKGRDFKTCRCIQGKLTSNSMCLPMVLNSTEYCSALYLHSLEFRETIVGNMSVSVLNSFFWDTYQVIGGMLTAVCQSIDMGEFYLVPAVKPWDQEVGVHVLKKG
jgi:hypothetical protein